MIAFFYTNIVNICEKRKKSNVFRSQRELFNKYVLVDKCARIRANAHGVIESGCL